MALWTQMQEEDTQPSDQFLWSLKELLTKNNLEVPFTVEKPVEDIVDDEKKMLKELPLCIKNNNLTKALSLRQAIHSKGSSISSLVESQIIELLVKQDKLKEAFEIAKNMLENSRPISKNILSFLTVKLSEAGYVSSLEYLDGKLSTV